MTSSVEYRKAYYAKNREKQNATMRAYYEKYREKILARKQSPEKRQREMERLRTWQQAHPEAMAAAVERHKARDKGLRAMEPCTEAPPVGSVVRVRMTTVGRVAGDGAYGVVTGIEAGLVIVQLVKEVIVDGEVWTEMGCLPEELSCRVA